MDQLDPGQARDGAGQELLEPGVGGPGDGDRAPLADPPPSQIRYTLASAPRASGSVGFEVARLRTASGASGS